MSQAMDTGITLEELRLAARNHGMPLEALQYDVTPVGLHYLLTHYDIPVIDVARWRLTIGGQVRNRLELSLDDLLALPAVTQRVTMECAGNGRALLDPRPLSQPWLLEAVGTGEWTGVALSDVLTRAGVAPDAPEVVFTGVDRGLEHGVEQVYERSLPVATAMGPDAFLAYALNGAPLPPQHGFPLRLVVPGWYGMTNVKWLHAITAVDAPFTGYQQTTSYRLRQREDEPGEPLTRMRPRALMVPPGVPDFFSRARHVAAGEHRLVGRAWSGFAPISAGRGQRRRRRDMGRGAGRGAHDRARLLAGVELHLEGPTRHERALVPRLRCRGQHTAGPCWMEPRRLRQQRGPARAGAGELTPSAARSRRVTVAGSARRRDGYADTVVKDADAKAVRRPDRPDGRPCQRSLLMSLTVTTLGTGSPLPDPNRAGPSTLVQTGSTRLLFDAGRGVVMRLAGAGVLPLMLDAVLLTHLHSDHITDLNDVITTHWVMSREPRPLHVYGPARTKEVVDGILAMLAPDLTYRVAHHDDLTWTPIIEVHELSAPERLSIGDATIVVGSTDHRPVEPTLGYRIEHDAAAVVIAGDGVPCAGLDELCADADVYVQTVIRADLVRSIPSRRLQEILEYHSTIEQAAQTAARCRVRTFVPTHFVPAIFPGDEPVWHGLAAAHFDGTIVLAEDLTVIEATP